MIDYARLAIVEHVRSVTNAFALRPEGVELEWREKPERSCLEIHKGSLSRPVCFSSDDLKTWPRGAEIPDRLKAEIFETVSWLSQKP